MFDDYLVQKQPIILVNKILKKFLFVCFWTIEIMFEDHLVREQAFLDYKNIDFT